MALVYYQCCICGDYINKKSKLDPCIVSILTNLKEPEHKQLEQAFFCHYECFRNSLDSELRMYLNFEEQGGSHPTYKLETK